MVKILLNDEIGYKTFDTIEESIDYLKRKKCLLEPTDFINYEGYYIIGMEGVEKCQEI